MAFPPLGNFDHVFFSVSIVILSNLKWDALFHCIAYDYSRADWDSLCDHLGDVPWEDIFELSALLLLRNFVSGFRFELMCISLIVSIRSSLTNVISMVFSCLYWGALKRYVRSKFPIFDPLSPLTHPC